MQTPGGAMLGAGQQLSGGYAGQGLALPLHGACGQPVRYLEVPMSVPMESPTHASMTLDGSPVCTPSNVATTAWRTQRCPLAPKAPRYRVPGPLDALGVVLPAGSPAGSPMSYGIPTPVNRWPSWQSSPMSAGSPIVGSFFPANAEAVSRAMPTAMPMASSNILSSPTRPPGSFAAGQMFGDVQMPQASFCMDAEVTTPSHKRQNVRSDPMSTTPQTPIKQSYGRQTPNKLNF